MSEFKKIITEIVSEVVTLVFERVELDMKTPLKEIALERRITANKARSEFGLSSSLMRRMPDELPYIPSETGRTRLFKIKDITEWLDSQSVGVKLPTK